MRDPRPAGMLLVSLAVSACRAAPPSAVVDLLARRPDLVSPTRLVRPGDEATRPLVIDGFSLTEDGLSLAPGAAEAAVEFHVVEPRDVRIVLTPAAPSGAQAAAWVNDEAVGQVSFREGPGSVTAPARVVRAGLNRLTLRFGASAPLVLESLAFGEGPAARWAPGDPAPLLQAAGSEVSWLVLPGEDRLELTGTLSAPGPAEATVEVVAETDGSPPRVLWSRTERVAGERRMAGSGDLSSLAGRPARLALRFRCTQPEASASWTRFRLARSARGSAPAEVDRGGPRARPNVVVFLVDTLRRDRLSLYGHPRPTSRGLERFAGEAVVFDQAWAQSSWTNPTVASLFTGEYPSAHGIRDHHGELPSRFVTLAEFLRERGYSTAAVVANPGVGSRSGFEQGFERFDVDVQAGAERVVEAALGRTARQPFFLYLHVMDSHYPYSRAPSPFDTLVRIPPGPPVRPEVLSIGKLRKGKVVPSPAELDHLLSLYDSEVAYVDHAFARLVDGLEALGLLDTTLVVFTSDHGEEFADHGGYYHGHTLYDELVRAALVIKPAGRFRPGTVRAAAQTVDLYPTIAAALGERPPGLPGRDLLRLPVDGPGRADPRPVFCETELRDRLKAVILGRHKLVLQDRRESGLSDPAWLFDLDADPGERVNRRRLDPIRAGYMAAILRRHLESLRGRSAGAERRALSEEDLESLRALGYLDGG